MDAINDQQLDLDPIQGRLDAATEGPWQRSEDYSDVLTPEGDHIASFWKTADGDLIAHAPADITRLVAEVRRLRAELALAANATEYRVPLPDNGGSTLLVRRQNLAHGDRWAVSTLAHGGGRAWTTEGWQDSISALGVDRLFCWPDPGTAVAEARDALAAVETGA